MTCHAVFTSNANLYVPVYVHNTKCFDELLDSGRFPLVRSLFRGRFLLKAQSDAGIWHKDGGVPFWYGFYADRNIPNSLRFKRIKNLEHVLSALRVPGGGKSRRELESRLKDPFQGAEAFFEVEVQSAALTLPSDFSARLHPPLGDGRHADFSLSPDGRTVFCEVTCFRPQFEEYVPSFGEVFTGVGISDLRIKNKFEGKVGQLSHDRPNVFIVGVGTSRPSETPFDVGRLIVDGIKQSCVGVPLAFLIVLLFLPKSDPVLILTKEFSCGSNSLSPKEKDAVQQLTRCFRRADHPRSR